VINVIALRDKMGSCLQKLIDLRQILHMKVGADLDQLIKHWSNSAMYMGGWASGGGFDLPSQFLNSVSINRRLCIPKSKG